MRSRMACRRFCWACRKLMSFSLEAEAMVVADWATVFTPPAMVVTRAVHEAAFWMVWAVSETALVAVWAPFPAAPAAPAPNVSAVMAMVVARSTA